jgi:hypothetical protein
LACNDLNTQKQVSRAGFRSFRFQEVEETGFFVFVFKEKFKEEIKHNENSYKTSIIARPR